MRLSRFDITKRLGGFVLSIAAVLYLVIVTQPAVTSHQVNQEITTPDETAPIQPDKSVESTQSKQTSQTNQAPLAKPAVQTSLTSSDNSPAKYIIKQGDTLSEIALTFGVSVNQLKELNQINNDNIFIGQKLLIPARGQVKADSVPKTVITKAPVPSRSRDPSSGRIGEIIHWNQVKDIFAIGKTAVVIDVDTGETFSIKRKGGYNHADCEPLTSADTVIMKDIYGSWSWSRRAVVLMVDNQKIAASMAGMPHGSQSIAKNDFNGHFDLHFSGSMTHGSEYTKTGIPAVDPDHQAMVRKAGGR